MINRGLEVGAAPGSGDRHAQPDRRRAQLVAGDGDEVGLDGRRDGQVTLSPFLDEARRQVVDARDRHADEVKPFSNSVLDRGANALIDAGEEAIDLMQLLGAGQRFAAELLCAARGDGTMAGGVASAEEATEVTRFAHEYLDCVPACTSGGAMQPRFAVGRWPSRCWDVVPLVAG